MDAAEIGPRQAGGPVGGAGQSQFAATRWSLVLAAGQVAGGSGTSANTVRQALEELIQAYWYPLYAFLRRQGNPPHQAEDLTQGFFAHLLEHHALAKADPMRGRFRSFLLTSLKHFAADEHDKSTAIKRGGRQKMLSLNTDEAERQFSHELADAITPERQFERSWAITLLNQVLDTLQNEYVRRGKGKQFELMRHCLDGQADAQSTEAVARDLGMAEGAVRVLAHRLRKRYRELLREQILQTVADADQVDEEIQYLLNCL